MKPKETKVTRENLTWLLESPVEVKMELLQSHLSVCQLIINQILEECQNSLAGARYDRNKPHGGRDIAGGAAMKECSLPMKDRNKSTQVD
ncbi:MAG: hypothetical protein IPL22_00815 [Bacteroidetes bacterium]|nr:hypothetical protein [Bacteroidota bacterium]